MIMNDPYSDFSEQDHNELCDWFDEQEKETERLLNSVCEGVEPSTEQEEQEMGLSTDFELKAALPS